MTLFCWIVDFQTVHNSVYYRDIHSINELKQQIQVWCNLDQDIINVDTDQWCKRLAACIRVKGIHLMQTT